MTAPAPATTRRELEELLSTLRTQAWPLRGQWAFQLLDTGLCLAVRVRDDMRREVRVSARDRAADLAPIADAVRAAAHNRARSNGGWSAWRPEEGEAHALCMTEIYEYEVRPGVGRCTGCKNETPYSDTSTRPRCPTCR